MEKRSLDSDDFAAPKKQKLVGEYDSISLIGQNGETPKHPITKYVGSFHISSGHSEFNLPITNDTKEIILIDLDNASGWSTQLLQYTLNKNNGTSPSNFT